MKKVLFVDRDGTIIVEPPVTYQIDSYDKLEFLPKVISSLSLIREKLDWELAMVSNQDGLGSENYPFEAFQGPHELMLKTLAGEGVTFDDIFIDPSWPEDHAPTRKPGIAMLTKYFDAETYDLANSIVIGDRVTDIRLAHNLGCKGILLQPYEEGRKMLEESGLTDDCVLITDSWSDITARLIGGERTAEVHRATKETDIRIRVDLDGHGQAQISTGLGFFDHMLEQIAKHSGMDLEIEAHGDLEVDEHHTIEDTAIVLGEVIAKALGDKRGIGRYGFCLPMDDCLCQVALDFGGRPWLVWGAEFHREKVGEMPTEMFLHFFKSFSDAARINLNIKAEGENEHHKIEGIFKALARALKMAIRRDITHMELPSSKGML